MTLLLVAWITIWTLLFGLAIRSFFRHYRKKGWDEAIKEAEERSKKDGVNTDW